jgi:uncharacterized protein YqhQ
MAKFYYGGQAVIEGVMMRGRRQATVSVRRPDGQIVTRSEVLPATLYVNRFARLPFVRGLVMLWEMIILGTRMMLFSANVHARAEADEEIPKSIVAAMIAFSLTFAVGVFFVLPLLVARAGGHALHGSLLSNLFEGVVRLALFVGYLLLMGRLPQMRRVFQYHGAEHKTINAYENGSDLTPRAIQRFSTIHIRCGTAFLLWVVVVSIVVFGLIGRPPILVGILERVTLVPVIAALSYEILRLGARYYSVPVIRAVLQPGLWLQRLTTREPADDQIEVAISALLPVLEADGAVEGIRPAAAAGAHYQPSQAVT